MKFWLLLSVTLSARHPPVSHGAPCPFGQKGNDGNHLDMPIDSIHQNAVRPGLRRRLTALSDNPDTKEKLLTIIDNRTKQRGLQVGSCFSTDTYDSIETDIADISAAFGSDDISRAHFLGGIVRLAAHDFMDYDKDTIPHMGPDGCIDMNHEANAGLPQDIWCDTCDLTTVYEANYSHISKADFWVAAANAVIHLTSFNRGLDLRSTFVWGRVDADSCPDSATRLPAASSCTEVEDVFLTRLGLSWTDAVALIGAHTLGRGSSSFSGHNGIWVDSVQESLIFDKQYYEEIFRRAWVPRNDGTDIQDWTWGGPNGDSPRFMLNTDMCLFFDLETNYPCCSRTDRIAPDGTNACGTELSSDVCVTYDDNHPRKEAAIAVDAFSRGGAGGINNDNNGLFYAAFTSAWEKATTNGWDNLQPLADSCAPTPPPTSVPTNAPTTSKLTAGPTKQPTSSPITSSPTASCQDVASFIDNKGISRTCSWVLSPDRNRCPDFAHLCPVTCGECECLLSRRVCTSNDDCCFNGCGLDGRCECLKKNQLCQINEQCCSGVCRPDGMCDGAIFS